MSKRTEFGINNKVIRIVFFSIVYAMLIIFYCVAHPPILNSPDDWIYASYSRIAIALPANRFWNPSRIFPETVMPLVADFGAFVLMPIIGDYLKSISIAIGLFVATVLLFYFIAFDIVIKKQCGDDKIRIGVDIVFILSHFLIFRNQQTNNTLFLLTAPNLYFFYVLPCLINYSLVFLWHSGRIHSFIDGGKGTDRLFRQGITVLIFYLALFSNMFSNIILAAYSGITFLRSILVCAKRRTKIAIMIKENKEYLFVIVAWVYSLICDLLGGRSAEIRSASEGPLFDRIKETLSNSFIWVTRFNKLFLCGLFVVGVLCVIKWLRNTDKFCGIRAIMTHMMFLMVIFVYEVLLCAVVQPTYIKRGVVGLVIFIPVIIAFSVGFLNIIMKWKKLMVSFPIIVLIMISSIRTNRMIFGTSDKLVKEANDYLIEQIIDADMKGIDEVTISYPYWYPDDMKTMSNGYISVIPSALYKHGIVSKMLEVHLE